MGSYNIQSLINQCRPYYVKVSRSADMQKKVKNHYIKIVKSHLDDDRTGIKKRMLSNYNKPHLNIQNKLEYKL